MRGIPHFNYPAFDRAAADLRSAGHEVFSPADHDRKTHGDKDISNPTGDAAQATADHGFDIRKAMGDDLAWICQHADMVALLPGWHLSKGATAERAVALAIGIAVTELGWEKAASHG